MRKDTLLIILVRTRLSRLILSAVYFERVGRLIGKALKMLANPFDYFFGPPRIATEVH